MMEDHEFCDHCPGCRPAVIDVQTGKPLPLDSPVMIAVNKVWNNETTYDQRKAFIEVTLHNSREPELMRLTQEVNDKIQSALK